MPRLKGNPSTQTVTIRGDVEIKIYSIPYSVVKTLVSLNDTKKENKDEEVEKMTQQILLKYTDIGEEEGYDPFGDGADALSFSEYELLLTAMTSSIKKNPSGQLEK